MKVEFDVGLPVPGANWCKYLPGAYKLACYALKYQDVIEKIPHAVSIARDMGAVQMDIMAAAVAVANNPNDWCNMVRKTGEVELHGNFTSR